MERKSKREQRLGSVPGEFRKMSHMTHKNEPLDQCTSLPEPTILLLVAPRKRGGGSLSLADGAEGLRPTAKRRSEEREKHLSERSIFIMTKFHNENEALLLLRAVSRKDHPFEGCAVGAG